MASLSAFERQVLEEAMSSDDEAMRELAKLVVTRWKEIQELERDIVDTSAMAEGSDKNREMRYLTKRLEDERWEFRKAVDALVSYRLMLEEQEAKKELRSVTRKIPMRNPRTGRFMKKNAQIA